MAHDSAGSGVAQIINPLGLGKVVSYCASGCGSLIAGGAFCLPDDLPQILNSNALFGHGILDRFTYFVGIKCADHTHICDRVFA
jgi:hypothetical protein